MIESLFKTFTFVNTVVNALTLSPLGTRGSLERQTAERLVQSIFVITSLGVGILVGILSKYLGCLLK